MADGAGKADGADKSAWLLALLAAALGAGALARYPLTAPAALPFAAAVALGVVLLALPLLLGEAALGQFRRRNVVDALGPGPWRAGGVAFAVVAIALAALLALVAAWAGRYALASFTGSYFDDPGRFLRLARQGWDAMLLALAALGVGVGLHAAGPGAVRTTLRTAGVLALLAAGTLALWGLLAGGADGRDAALAFDLGAIDGRLVAAGVQQALLPGLVAAGVVLTASCRVPDRGLPREATVLALVWILAPAAVGAGLVAFAHDEGLTLAGGVDAAFTQAPLVFAAVGGTAGGVLSGLFFGALLAGCLAAIVLLLEVPAQVVAERAPAWKPPLAVAAAGLMAYLAAVPLAFVAGAAWDLDLALRAIVAPLGGLALALHVGWVRPEVLDGFTVGDAKHRLDPTLRPALRFAVPAALLALLVLGTMGALVDWGVVERDAGGLWKAVP